MLSLVYGNIFNLILILMYSLIRWSGMSHAWSVLSLNVVLFVLKRGPFCPGCGPFCPGCGPFCPWSVLSMVRYVPNSVHTGP